ncbi:MAG: nucleoside triphosphate pyrophosphohydrolase, partial [Ruthenibacterium sp.]
CEELGDILLQVALHTQMEAEKAAFTFDDVTSGICQKLILRHPHVFGDVKADTPEEVLQNWETIKRVEKHRENAGDNLDSVPAALPALMRSRKVQKRAADYGFRYENVGAAMAGLDSEIAELKAALAAQDAQSTEEELGDVLFSVVNVSRFTECDAEEALGKSTAKFVRRVKAVEQLALLQGKELDVLSAEELDKLWRQAKVFAEP